MAQGEGEGAALASSVEAATDVERRVAQAVECVAENGSQECAVAGETPAGWVVVWEVEED